MRYFPSRSNKTLIKKLTFFEKGLSAYYDLDVFQTN